MRLSRPARLALAAFMVLGLAVIYVPLGVVLISSFSPEKTFGWPPSGFTFSLTLGDYITPTLVSSTQFIGNVVYANVGVANNLPLAAALAAVPVAIMVVFLLAVRRTGALDNL